MIRRLRGFNNRLSRISGALLIVVLFGGLFMFLILLGRALPKISHSEDHILLVITLFVVFLQTLANLYSVMDQMYPTRTVFEYTLMTVEFGSMTAYFNSGEPNQMARDGWEIVQMNGNGLLLRRPLG